MMKRFALGFFAVYLLVGCGGTRASSEMSGLEARKSLPVVPTARRDGAAGSRPLSENKPAALAPFPRALSLDAFADGDRIADLTALSVEPQVLLAWVTYVDPGGGPRANKESQRKVGKGSPLAPRATMGATVSVRPLDPKLEPVAAPKVISTKADAAGGVALAPSAIADELALAWVGKDAGVSQVFLTRLSRAGEKQTQKMLTHAKGDCSDVALAKLGTGWVVAWVEQDAQSAILYAAKVGRDLQRTSAEQVIARARGEASQVRLMARGDDVLLAWNETQGDAFSGVYAARLAADTVSLRSDPVRLAVSPGRVHGLRVAGFGEGLVFAWLEGRDPAHEATKERAAVFLRVEPSMKTSSEPTRVPIDVDASSLAINCGDHACRVMTPGADRGELVLDGFIYDGARATKPSRVATIPNVSSEDVSPILLGDWLLFAEDNLRGRGRVRKAELSWR